MFCEMCSMFLMDFYKTVHPRQFPKNRRMVSYLVPRMSRLAHENKLTVAGMQGFAMEYLVEHFNRFFFSLPKEMVLQEYRRVLDNTLSPTAYDIKYISDLHDLGYLPLQMRIIPEGTRVPMKVPMIELSNTHPDFGWIIGSVESLLSCNTWHPMVSANVGYWYRQIVNKYWDQSVEADVPRNTAIGDFSFRGQESFESAVKSSAAFLLSFTKTATLPAIPYLEQVYGCRCETYNIGKGGASTEHATMNSNEAIDGNEETFFVKLLKELYPNDNISVVMDSKDYWNFIKVIIPRHKKLILEHNGVLFCRGDSGDPVDIVTKTVFSLWETFGGTINSKGFKVLDWHIRAIYGDSITPQRAEQIYQILIANGFACNNVYLGAGSFSMQCLEEDGVLKPFTRDTYGIAVKTGYLEDKQGRAFFVFKNPITDTASFKKSNKGCCVVERVDGELVCKDGFTWEEANSYAGNEFVVLFRNSKMYNTKSLEQVRQLLHNNTF